MKSKVAIIALFICVLVIFSGCMSTPPKEGVVMEDLREVLVEETDGVVGIDDFSITKRQTNKDTKEDHVYCQVMAHSSKVSYKREYYMQYNYFDDSKEWFLDTVEPFNEGEWRVSPNTGVDTKSVEAAVRSIKKKLVGTDKITNISEISRNSLLDEKSDLVTVRVEAKTDLYKIATSVDISFKFSEAMEEWEYKGYVRNDDWETTWLLVGSYEYGYSGLWGSDIWVDFTIDNVSDHEFNGILTYYSHNKTQVHEAPFTGRFLDVSKMLDSQGEPDQALEFVSSCSVEDHSFVLKFGGDKVEFSGWDGDGSRHTGIKKK